VFTGALKTRTQAEAWEDAARAGTHPGEGRHRGTNILVAETQPPAVLTGAATTGKTQPRIRQARQGDRTSRS